MPILQLTSDLHYYYTDSGAPSHSNYPTIILIHGYTFHSGTFQRLHPVAKSHSLRIICLNRREYSGTSPFSTSQLNILAFGSEAERIEFLEEQGVELGMFIDALISRCLLPKDGGIYIFGWSMGNMMLLSLVASVRLLPDNLKNTLRTYLKGFILWDAPSQILGIPSPPDSYIPYWDENLAPEDRLPAFAVWVSSYWKHGDISTRKVEELEHRVPDTSKNSTTENMTIEEMRSITDFAPVDKYETLLVEPDFSSVHAKQTAKALFDVDTRNAWSGVSFSYIYGDANPWCIIYAGWVMEEKMKTVGSAGTPIQFRIIEGANHFLMWDDPQRTIATFLACM